MIRAALVIGAAAVLLSTSVEAAQKPSAYARTATCKARDVTISFDGKRAVVTAKDKVLARATRLTRSIDRACARSRHLGLWRQNLDKTATGAAKVTCRGGGPTTRIEVEPVRSASGRVIGSRLAVWLHAWGRESAEVFVSSRAKWFSWSSGSFGGGCYST